LSTINDSNSLIRIIQLQLLITIFPYLNYFCPSRNPHPLLCSHLLEFRPLQPLIICSSSSSSIFTLSLSTNLHLLTPTNHTTQVSSPLPSPHLPSITVHLPSDLSCPLKPLLALATSGFFFFYAQFQLSAGMR
jgi:hypothetical protein